MNAAPDIGRLPASDQFDVPADAVGFAGSSTWSDEAGGLDHRGGRPPGTSGQARHGKIFSTPKGRLHREQRFAGGRQTFAGLFAERSQGEWGGTVHGILGLRLDRWEDSDGHLRNILRSNGSLLLENIFPTKTGNEFSPSAGLTWQAAPELSFHVSGQHAFRQPTLNELYRPFRQGSSSTLANANLSTEHADTGEIGAGVAQGPIEPHPCRLRGAPLEDPVSNVTLARGPGTFPLFGTPAAGATGLERLNLGRVDTQGAQLGAEWRQSDEWSIQLSVINEERHGRRGCGGAPRLSEIPCRRSRGGTASLGAAWHPRPFLWLSLRVARVSSQFDDDQNLLPLAAATVVDASARARGDLRSLAEVFSQRRQRLRRGGGDGARRDGRVQSGPAEDGGRGRPFPAW